MINQKITSEELNWIGIDFDNCLCENSGLPDFIPTLPIKGSHLGIARIVAMGYKPIIFTARPWSEFNIVKNWLKDNNFTDIKTIICGKPLMRTMIDDRAIGFRGDWDDAVDQII